MAQQLVTVIWCDYPHGEEQVPARPFTVGIATADEAPTTYDIDLCEACAKDFFDLRAEVVEHGRPQQTRKSRADRRPAVASGPVHPPQPCPATDCDYVTTSATGLAAHAKHVHELTVAELDGTAHMPCIDTTCTRRFSARQGLSVHVRAHHPDRFAELQAMAR